MFKFRSASGILSLFTSPVSTIFKHHLKFHPLHGFLPTTSVLKLYNILGLFPNLNESYVHSFNRYLLRASLHAAENFLAVRKSKPQCTSIFQSYAGYIPLAIASIITKLSVNVGNTTLGYNKSRRGSLGTLL